MKADYHVHYYIDACANESMTFENIENEAYKLGLEEIAVLKHYSATLPNGEQDWVCWHRIIPAEFEKYLKEKNEYKPKHPIKIYSGVETELVNERGDINIPQEAIDRIDRVALSVHYMIDLECLDMDLMLYPDLSFCPADNNEHGRALVERWRRKILGAGAENVVKGLVNGYCNAIKNHPEIRTLAHINDGVQPLRVYLADVDSLEPDSLARMFDPLFETMKQKDVLWEISGKCRSESVVKRARDAGVRFAVTSDSHFISGGWANLCDHDKVEEYVERLIAE